MPWQATNVERNARSLSSTGKSGSTQPKVTWGPRTLRRAVVERYLDVDWPSASCTNAILDRHSQRQRLRAPPEETAQCAEDRTIVAAMMAQPTYGAGTGPGVPMASRCRPWRR